MYVHLPPPPPAIVAHVNDGMRTSPRALRFIAAREGCYLRPYHDVAGNRTVGIGHLIGPEEEFDDEETITIARAQLLLVNEIASIERVLKKWVKVRLTQDQFDALVSFAFNCGIGVFRKSRVIEAVNSGEFEKVPERLLEWGKATVRGRRRVIGRILERRMLEGDMFSGRIKGVPRTWIIKVIMEVVSFVETSTSTRDTPFGRRFSLEKTCQR